MRYVRIYADAEGVSHYGTAELAFSMIDFAPPAPPFNVSDLLPATGVRFLNAPPGWYGDWHPTPRRQLMLYVTGEMEVETSDGEVRRFGTGSITVLEDTTGKGHRSQVIGDVPVVLAAIQLPDAD